MSAIRLPAAPCQSRIRPRRSDPLQAATAGDAEGLTTAALGAAELGAVVPGAVVPGAVVPRVVAPGVAPTPWGSTCSRVSPTAMTIAAAASRPMPSGAGRRQIGATGPATMGLVDGIAA